MARIAIFLKTERVRIQLIKFDPPNSICCSDSDDEDEFDVLLVATVFRADVSDELHHLSLDSDLVALAQLGSAEEMFSPFEFDRRRRPLRSCSSVDLVLLSLHCIVSFSLQHWVKKGLKEIKEQNHSQNLVFHDSCGNV